MNSRLKFMRRSVVVWLSLVGSAFTVPPTMAQSETTANPLDPDAVVEPTRYETPLADFRAFEPDEPMQSWEEANRRVGEIGGWRTYLRQANPRPSGASSPQPANSSPAGESLKGGALSTTPSIPSPVPGRGEEPSGNSAVTTSKSTVSAVSNRTEMVRAQSINRGSSADSTPLIPALAEGGPDQDGSAVVLLPNLPSRISRADCPRVMTGLRLPFAHRSIEISAPLKALLDRLVPCFRARSYVVAGHSDGRGPRSANLVLSHARADAVAAYLIANGAPADRVISQGFGEARPVDTNKTKRGRARNRRIDFYLNRSK